MDVKISRIIEQEESHPKRTLLLIYNYLKTNMILKNKGNHDYLIEYQELFAMKYYLEKKDYFEVIDRIMYINLRYNILDYDIAVHIMSVLELYGKEILEHEYFWINEEKTVRKITKN